MNRCADCKHFGEANPVERWSDDDDGMVSSEHHDCERVLHGNGDYDHNNVKAILSEPAVVNDGSGYAAHLLVLPTFGCTLWEAKP